MNYERIVFGPQQDGGGASGSASNGVPEYKPIVPYEFNLQVSNNNNFEFQPEAKRSLAEAVTHANTSSLIIISGDKCTGKTKLLKEFESGFGQERGVLHYDSAVLANSVNIDAIFEQTHSNPGLKVILFDDFTEAQNLESRLRYLGKKMVADPEVLVVIAGGRNLEAASDKPIPGIDSVVCIPLRPFTKDVLKELIEANFIKEKGRVQMDTLFEEGFLDYLIPNTEVPVATIDSTVKMLQLLSRRANVPLVFSGDLYRTAVYRKTEVSLFDKDSLSHECTVALEKLIRDTYDPRSPMKCLSLVDFIRMMPIKGEHGEDTLNAIMKFEESGVLVRTPEGKYLPSQMTFLGAVYNPLISGVELVAREEEKREQADQKRKQKELGNAEELLTAGAIDEHAYGHLRDRILGIEEIMGMVIHGKITMGEFLERKGKVLDFYKDYLVGNQ